MKKNPRIGIDALGIDIEGGARTSILQMLEFVINSRQDWKFIIYLSKLEPRLDAPNVKQVILPFSRGIVSRLFMQIFLPFEVLLRGIDLIHFTKSQASLVPFTKKIFTIHDVTTLQHPEIHSTAAVFYWKHIQPFMAKRMDAVFTVSNNAANDIEERLHVKREKITVIYNTSQFEATMEYNNHLHEIVIKKFNLPKDYFLYVGLLALKKNLHTLIEAYNILNSGTDSLPQLLLVGPLYAISDGSHVLDRISNLNLNDQVRYLGKLPKDDLYYVFKNASIFLFPSYHEGFGIPCLEAMQMGVPLIASKASAIPEVVGPAGVLIEDYMSAESWAKEIRQLQNNPEKKKQLIKEGLKQYKKISAEHSFAAVINVYQQLITNNNIS